MPIDMLSLDPASFAVLAAASVGLTQIVKDLGLQGQWLKIACVLISTVLGYVMIFQPALWSALIVPLVGATGTGGVSLAKEMVSARNLPSGD